MEDRPIPPNIYDEFLEKTRENMEMFRNAQEHLLVSLGQKYGLLKRTEYEAAVEELDSIEYPEVEIDGVIVEFFSEINNAIYDHDLNMKAEAAVLGSRNIELAVEETSEDIDLECLLLDDEEEEDD